MPGEAKIKLSIDTTQAQREVKLIDDAINSLGSGKPITGIGNGDGEKTSTSSTTDMSKLVDLQTRFNKRFDTYAGETNRSYQSIIKKLDDLVSASGGSSSPTPSPSNTGGSPTSNPSSPSKNLSQDNKLSGVLKKLATGATIASAVNSLLSYMKAGSTSSKNSEMLAYQTYGTSGLYKGSYDTARNAAADIGSPYGYNVYDTLGVQSALIGSTGASSEKKVSSDTKSALKTARTMNVDENSLTSAFGGFYQSGTYTNGEMSRFANLYATSVEQAGMKGRENEQLEVLESINDLLDKNLTKVSEGQYETALGLYSMFSSSDQSMSGTKAANVTESLNDAITGGDTAMDIALGRYSGKYATPWQFEQQKEKGVTDSENLASIINYFENYLGTDLNSDTGKYAFQQFLASNGANLDTTTINSIVDHKDEIKSGEYADIFGDSVENQKGTKSIDSQYDETYGSSKLEDMNTYEAESLNAQERIGDTSNEIKSKLESLYNDMPQWMQNIVSGGGAALGGIANVGGSIFASWAGNKIFDKLFKTGASAAGAAGARSAGASGGGLLAGLGSKISSAASSAGSTISSAASSAGSAISGAASGLYTSASSGLINFAAAGGSSLLNNFLPMAPAIPDAIKGWGDVFSDVGDSFSYETDDDYKAFVDWDEGNHQDTDDAFSDMKKAIKNGTYDDWVKDYVSKSYKVDPKSGKSSQHDELIEDLSQVIAKDTHGGTTMYSLKTADAATDWYSSLDKNTLNSLLKIDSIDSAQKSLSKSESDAKKAKAKAGDYYNGYEDEKDSPFYGHETTFGYEGGGDYTKKDLKTLKNTMIKDYVEKGSINVQDYFGNYTYQGGKYASYVNDVLQDMFGEDTGVTSNFASELFKGQNETGQDLNEGIESILKDYKDEYSDIVSSANKENTTALEDNTKALQNLSSNGLLGLPNSTATTTSIFGNSKKAGSKTSKLTAGLASGLSSVVSVGLDGSHATGCDYVPYDGYISELHKGEKVLDKAEADKYRSSSQGMNSDKATLEIKFSGSIGGVTSENQQQIINAVVSQVKNYMGNSNMMNKLANNTVRVAN